MDKQKITNGNAIKRRKIMDVLNVQEALYKQGFNPGEIDGIWGRRTIEAVKLFQKARGLVIDGIVGPVTAQSLLGVSTGSSNGQIGTPKGPLIWYQEAVDLIGVREKPGRESNEQIIEWAKDLNIDYNGDDIPWCGLFVAHCIGSTLPDEVLPRHPLMARSWNKFGSSCTPQKGAILVFWRVKQNGPYGHVGFYKSEDSTAYHVLGGNQSDSVSITRISKSRLLSARWPRTASALSGAVVKSEGIGELSHSNIES